MDRQKKFEQAYAEAHGLPVETFEAYRMGDTYRLPGIAKCWRFWNMALDSVVIVMPEIDGAADDPWFTQDRCREVIEAASLRVVITSHPSGTIGYVPEGVSP